MSEPPCRHPTITFTPREAKCLWCGAQETLLRSGTVLPLWGPWQPPKLGRYAARAA
jgi:hypothetical protein